MMYYNDVLGTSDQKYITQMSMSVAKLNRRRVFVQKEGVEG